MNDQKQSIEGLVDIYRKTCSLAEERIDISGSGQNTDLRIAMMFIKYAQMHNMSGKFEKVFDKGILLSACEDYLMKAGNVAYFEDRLASYRNSFVLMHMLQDALQLLERCDCEITLRKKNPVFLDKIHDGHMIKIEKLENEIGELENEISEKEDAISKFGFLSRQTVQRRAYNRLEKEVCDLRGRRGQLMTDLATMEEAYQPYHVDYHTYMKNLSVEDETKISRYFFSPYDEGFEQIYGLTNQFEPVSAWLRDNIDKLINVIGTKKDAYELLLAMCEEAKRCALALIK